MTTLEILRGARELLSDRKRWTRNVFARYADSHEAPPLSPKACKFCAMGAIHRAADAALSPSADPFLRLESVLPADVDFCGIAHFNDDPRTTHADVLAAFDRAIAAEEARA